MPTRPPQFRLLTLLALLTVLAVALALVSHDPLERALREDLEMPHDATLTVLEVDHAHPRRVIGVISRAGQHRLFVAFHDFHDPESAWWNMLVHDTAEMGTGFWPAIRELDHFPTPDEIAHFRADFGVAGRRGS